MHSTRTLLLFLAAVSLSVTLAAQQPPPPLATITGHVVCADTNAPARFAKVLLKSASSTPPGNDVFTAMSQIGNAAGKKNAEETPEEAAEQKAQMAAASRMMASLADLAYTATIAADGTYTFTNVKPGTYYVHAMVPGYIDPYAAIAPADLTSPDAEVRRRVAAKVTTVTVDGPGSMRADLRVERGASITGRVAYEDGTPAAGWTVRPVYAQAPGENPYAALGVDASDLDLAHAAQNAVTDDTGRFHIAGLTPGDYTLQARLATKAPGVDVENPNGLSGGAGSMGAAGMVANMTSLRISVYSGNAVRLADAKAIHLTTGEDHAGAEITVPLHALHSISGRVVAKSDGRAVNSGVVDLNAEDAEGKADESLHLTATVHADGTFRFEYVPGPITFLLKASRARDMEPAPAKAREPDSGFDMPALRALAGPALKAAHVYGPATATVQVSDADVDGVTLSVPDAGTGAQ